MILLTILALMAILLITVVIGGISLLGSIGVVVFGDVIVCVGFIGLIIYFIVRKKRRK